MIGMVITKSPLGWCSVRSAQASPCWDSLTYYYEGRPLAVNRPPIRRESFARSHSARNQNEEGVKKEEVRCKTNDRARF